MNRITERLAILSVQTSALVAKELEVLRSARHDERGSITIEQVLWAVAIIGLVALVVGAISTFVSREAGKIK